LHCCTTVTDPLRPSVTPLARMRSSKSTDSRVCHPIPAPRGSAAPVGDCRVVFLV
jgi:hypothetical protein